VGKSISIILKEEDIDTRGDSYFRVSGDDPARVDATFVDLERAFNAIRPQSLLVHKLRWIITIPLAVAIGYSWTRLIAPIIAAVVPSPAEGAEPDWAIYLRQHPAVRIFSYVSLVLCPVAVYRENACAVGR
jgi:hypothetical protein